MKIPPAYATGDVVGRHSLGRHIDNAEYLHGIASRWRTYPFGFTRTLDADGATGTVWRGYHRYQDDATILHWDGTATAGPGAHLHVRVAYNGVDVLDQEIAASATADFSGTHDLSAHALTDNNLYTVSFRYETESRAGAILTFHCPYTTQAGTADALTFTAPHAVVDTDLSATTEYAAWRDNDLYFQVCLPSDPAQCQVWAPGLSGGTIEFYWGWLPERFGRIYYKVRLTTADPGQHLYLTYNPGADQQVVDITTANADVESFMDLTYPNASFTEGAIRQFKASILTAPAVGSNATIYYVRNAPIVTDALAHAFTTLATITPATSLLYGNTTTARLAYLNENQNWLDHGLAIEGRQDYAVASDNSAFYELDEYRFIRRGDTLNYRVHLCTLEYTGGASPVLSDDDLPACGYNTLDLNSVDGLGYGMEYRIVPGGGGTLTWAEEC